MTEPLCIVFPQPAKVPSENQARRIGFGGRAGAIAFHHQLRQWKVLAWTAWKNQRSGPVGAVLGSPCQVRVVIQFRTNHKRDPHNYVGTVVKSIIDGLVLANVWPDDNSMWVEVLEPQCLVVNAPPQTALMCTVEFYPKEEVI